jgi:hypothetical protein
MAGEQERKRRRRLRPARPRKAVVRAWLILLAMLLVYAAVMLTIYAVEPGLR